MHVGPNRHRKKLNQLHDDTVIVKSIARYMLSFIDTVRY